MAVARVAYIQEVLYSDAIRPPPPARDVHFCTTGDNLAGATCFKPPPVTSGDCFDFSDLNITGTISTVTSTGSDCFYYLRTGCRKSRKNELDRLQMCQDGCRQIPDNYLGKLLSFMCVEKEADYECPSTIDSCLTENVGFP